MLHPGWELSVSCELAYITPKSNFNNPPSRVFLARDELNLTQHLDCPGFTKDYPADGVRKIYNCTLSRDERANMTRTPSWWASKSIVRGFPITPNNSTSVSSRPVVSNSNEIPCVGRSFTYPGWYVDATRNGDSDSGINITVRHKATGYIAHCAMAGQNQSQNLTCLSVHSSQVRPGLLEVSDIGFEYNKTAWEIQISQAWVCGNNSQVQT